MFLLFCLATRIRESFVYRMAYRELLNEMKFQDLAYVLIAPHTNLDYSTIVDSYTTAVQNSYIEASFLLFDPADQGIKPEEINVTHYPALIISRKGVIEDIQYSSFDEEFFQHFFTETAIYYLPKIQTQEELQYFYNFNALGLIIAFEDASEENYTVITEFYRYHFHEFTVAFANHSLFPKPGCYLYRYIDSSITEIPEINRTTTHSEIISILHEYTRPLYYRINDGIGHYFESMHYFYSIIIDRLHYFYMTNEQLELARSIEKETGLNVTYADFSDSRFLTNRFALPLSNNKEPTLALIDRRDSRGRKYLYTGKLTVDNCLKFIKDALEEKIKPLYKSEEIEGKVVEDGVLVVSANSLDSVIKEKKTLILLLYYSYYAAEISFYKDSVKVLKKAYRNIEMAKFSLTKNDWSGENIDFDAFPYVVIYENGKIKYHHKCETTMEPFIKQITNALEGKQEEL